MQRFLWSFGERIMRCFWRGKSAIKGISFAEHVLIEQTNFWEHLITSNFQETQSAVFNFFFVFWNASGARIILKLTVSRPKKKKISFWLFKGNLQKFCLFTFSQTLLNHFNINNLFRFCEISQHVQRDPTDFLFLLLVIEFPFLCCFLYVTSQNW